MTQNPNKPNLVTGAIYEHYKGKTYRVLGIARHSETLEEMVLYEALYENDLGKIWVRPKAMFLENIELEGKTLPRFRILEK